MRLVWSLLVLAVLFAGCRSRSVGGGDESDGSVGSDAEVIDAAVPADAAIVPDGGETQCECSADQVFRVHTCVATTELGCGPSCGGEEDCPEGWRCETCGAATSCNTFDCRGACVRNEYYQPLDAGELRIEPVWVGESVESEISIVGHPFTMAAMFYLFEVDGTPATEVWQDSFSCTTVVRVPPLPVGRYPVRVSQYGGGPPWRIAGFLHYGVPQSSCAQPYRFCDGAAPCCSGSASEENFSCVSGRCQPDIAP